MKKYEKPYIMTLEEKFVYTKQCKMFGMPKRSCKNLPSGTIMKKNNAERKN